MDAQVAFSRGKPGYEVRLLACQAQAAAYFERMAAARAFYTRAIDAASRTKAPERTAAYRVLAMWREAEVGNAPRALTWADASVLKSESPFVQRCRRLASAILSQGCQTTLINVAQMYSTILS